MVLSARASSKRAGLALLAVACVAVIGLAGPPACGTPCTGQDQFFCTPGGAECVCAAPCSTFNGCATADPTESRFCYLDIGGDPAAGVCLPALFFTGPCPDGSLCSLGQCDALTGACDLLCAHSAECTSGCCSYGPTAADNANPTCNYGDESCLP